MAKITLKQILFSSFLLCASLQGNLQSNLVSTQEAVTKEEWKKFSSAKNGFYVELPTIPDHVSQKVDIPQTELSIKYDTYISEPSESVVYVISVWYYPAEIDMSKPEVNLQDGFGGMLSALPGSQVLKMEIGEFSDKFKALDFLVKHEDVFFQGKLILVYNTLYQVFSVYKENMDVKGNYERFMNSFTLDSPEQNKPAPSKTPEKKEEEKVHKMNV